MSQEKLILAHLKKYNCIGVLTALRQYGCFRLAARISDLKHHGHKIVTDTVTINKKRIARYYLVDNKPALGMAV